MLCVRKSLPAGWHASSLPTEAFFPPLMIPIFEISAINCDVFSQPWPVSGSLREANYLSIECFHVRHLVANVCIATQSCGFSQLLVHVVTSFLGSSEEWRVEGKAGLSKHILFMLSCHCGMRGWGRGDPSLPSCMHTNRTKTAPGTNRHTNRHTNRRNVVF